MSAPLRWLGTPELVVRPYDGAWDRETDGRPVRHVAIVDTETLGREPDAPVIEIAVRSAAYDRVTGELLGLVNEYASFRDPGVPIPAEITALTGITDADVRDQNIDTTRLAAVLDADLIVAHSASFDRPHVDRLVATRAPWACSCTQVPWKALGLPSAALGALCLAHGFYGVAHRAMGDVACLLRLLSTTNAETGRTYFSMLLEEARKPVCEVFAWGSPFEVKDRLRERGYRWRAELKVWSRTVPHADAASERAWLGAWSPKAQVVRIDPRRRFAVDECAPRGTDDDAPVHDITQVFPDLYSDTGRTASLGGPALATTDAEMDRLGRLLK